MRNKVRVNHYLLMAFASVFFNFSALGITQDTWSTDKTEPIVLTDDLEVTIGSGVTVTCLGEISGAHKLIKKGAGTMVLAVDNTFSGGLEIQAGFVEVRSGQALGLGKVTILGQRDGFTGDCCLRFGAADQGKTEVTAYVAKEIEVSGNSTREHPALEISCRNNTLAGNITAAQALYINDNGQLLYDWYRSQGITSSLWSQRVAGDSFMDFKGSVTAYAKIYLVPDAKFTFSGSVTTPLFVSDLEGKKPRGHSTTKESEIYGDITFKGVNCVGEFLSGYQNLSFAGAGSMGGACMHSNNKDNVVERSRLTFSGGDQIVAGFTDDYSANVSDRTSKLECSAECTLTITGTCANAELLSCRQLAGAYSFVLDAVDNPGFVQVLTNRANGAFTGALVVKNGTLKLRAGETFAKLSKVEIGENGRLVADSSDVFQNAIEELRLATGAQFSLAGGTINAAKVYVDGAQAVAGTYTAAQLGISGDFSVNASSSPTVLVTANWVGGGATTLTSDMENWRVNDAVPASLPLKDGSLRVILTSGAKMTYRDGDYINGITSDIAADYVSGGTITPFVIEPEHAGDTLTLYNGLKSDKKTQLVLKGHFATYHGVDYGSASSSNGQAINYAAKVLSNKDMTGMILPVNVERNGNATGLLLVLDGATIDLPLYVACDSNVSGWMTTANSVNVINGNFYDYCYKGHVHAEAGSVIKVMNGFESANCRYFSGSGEFQFHNRPMKVNSGGYIDNRTTVSLFAPSNNVTGAGSREGLDIGGGCTLSCHVNDALCETFQIRGTSTSANSLSVLELNQTTQRVGRLQMNAGGLIRGGGTALLEITGKSRSNASSLATLECAGDVVGQVSLHIAAPGKNYNLCRSASAFSSTGDLIVSAGTNAIASGATWLNGTNFVVKGDGVLMFAQGGQVNEKFSQFHFSENGKVYIPSGVTLDCCSAFVDDGTGEQILPEGEYGMSATGLMEGRVVGGGILNVIGNAEDVGDFESPLTVTEPTAIMGDHTWTIHQKETLCFDNALTTVDGTIRVTGDKVSNQDNLGVLEFRGTNIVDGAIIVTSALVKVSGLLGTPGHVDQGAATLKGANTLSIVGSGANDSTLSYLSVSNAVVEKPVYISHKEWSGIVTAGTNVFKGAVSFFWNTWAGLNVLENTELIFEGGVSAGSSIRMQNNGTVRIRNKPINATAQTGFSLRSGTLSLETTGNKFVCLSVGYDNSTGTAIHPSVEFGCNNAIDTSTGGALLIGYLLNNSTKVYYPFPAASTSRAHVYLHDTVQRVNTLCGSTFGTIHGENGARIEICAQTVPGKVTAENCFFASALDGDVSLAMYGGGIFVMTNQVFETDGSLIVTNGTVLLAQGAVWKGKGGVTVSGQGLLKTTAAQQLDADSTVLRLADNGKVDIPAGVILSVKVVEVFDGGEWVRLTDAAQYGGDATGLMAERITGGGTLNVTGVDPEGVKSFSLEWNERRATGVPYEVEIDPVKVSALGGVSESTEFRVFATVGEIRQQLDVTCLEGSRPGRVALRFVPPDGTTALTCKIGTGMRILADSATTDNLLAGALSDGAVWQLDGSIQRENLDNGIRFSNPVVAKANKTYANYEVAVPESWRGKAVRFEMDCKSETELVWTGFIKIRQFDVNGVELPESVSDPRWTSHLRPENVLTDYRENGRIRPDTVKLVVKIEVRGTDAKFDEYGMALASGSDKGLAKLVVSRLVLRKAGELPFPRYRDDNFGGGISGAAGDCSIRLGGSNTNTFFFATRSQASWAEDIQIRKESEIFFPSGSGTVEAWIKPASWDSSKESTAIFDAHDNGTYHGAARGCMMGLSYRHSKKTFSLSLKDYLGTAYSGSGEMDLPIGKWTHLAVQWTVGGSAELFVDGVKIVDMPIPDFKAEDLTGLDYPNDRGPSEFFFGSHVSAVRQRSVWYDRGYYPIFDGEADLLRISTGVRYSSDGFTPPTGFEMDANTRALFNFDRSFDGVAGGGVGFISGSLRSVADRVDHRLTMRSDFDGCDSVLQYYPDQVEEAVDPFVVLNKDNYTTLPTDDDFLNARQSFTRSVELVPGGSDGFVLPSGTLAEYVEIRNVGSSSLVYPQVNNVGDFDTRSYGDIRDSLDLDALSPQDRANRIFQFMINASDYFMIHTAYFPKNSDQPAGVEYSQMLLLNSFCGFECGPLNAMLKSVLSGAGRLASAQTYGYEHCFEEVFFDGKNHMYDLSAQQFITAMDNETSAYLNELDEQPGALARQGRNPSFYVRKSSRTFDPSTAGYSAKFAMTLRPMERFIQWFDNNGEQVDLQFASKQVATSTCYNDVCGASTAGGYSVWRVNRFFPQAANGFLVFDGRYDANNPAFVAEDANSFTYAVDACYPIVAANYTATLLDGSVAPIQISTDNGGHWRSMPEGTIRYPVRGRMAYLVKVLAAPSQVKRFHAMTEVQINARILPGRARAGQNLYTLTAESGERAKVTIGYRLPAKQIVIRGGAYTGTIPGAERQLVVVDPASPLVLEVEGASPAACVKTFGGLSATLANGVLTVSAGTLAKGFGAVDIIDGDAVKQLTVLVSPNARLVTAGGGLVGQGDATLLPAAEGRVQPCVNFTGTGSQASANFASLPAGKYAILNLCRFASHSASYQTAGISMTVGGDSTTSCSCSRDINSSCCYYKARYGVKGERSNFKWDYPNDPTTSYPTEMMRVFDIGTAFSQVDFTGTKDASEGVELAAALIVPVDKATEEEFYCDIVKVLCGLNCQPWRVAEKAAYPDVDADLHSPAIVTEPMFIDGDATWTISSKESIVLDNAIRESLGTIHVKADRVTSDADLGVLEFRGTNIVDGAIIVTSALVKVSGLLGTTGHVDQGAAVHNGESTLTIDGFLESGNVNTRSYLIVSNAVIEKPVYITHSQWSDIVTYGTNVFKGAVKFGWNAWAGLNVPQNTELIFEGGVSAGSSVRVQNNGTVRIQNKPISATAGTGFALRNGTLSLETTSNKFAYLSAGYDVNTGAGIQPTIRFTCDNVFDLSAGTALLNGFTSGYVPFPDSTASRGHIYLGSTVQKVNRLVGSRCSVVHGDSGARIEIFNQTAYGSYLTEKNLFFASELDGDVSLAMCGQGTFILTNQVFETIGSLTVTNGTILLAQNAVWNGKGPVTVSGQGLLQTTGAQHFDADATVLRFADSGRIEIPAGVILSVNAVEVFDGGEWVRLSESPRYDGGATGLMAGRITGGGTLNITELPDEPTVETTAVWTGAAGDGLMATLGNWLVDEQEPTALDLTSGKTAVILRSGTEMIPEEGMRVNSISNDIACSTTSASFVIGKKGVSLTVDGKISSFEKTQLIIRGRIATPWHRDQGPASRNGEKTFTYVSCNLGVKNPNAIYGQATKGLAVVLDDAVIEKPVYWRSNPDYNDQFIGMANATNIVLGHASFDSNAWHYWYVGAGGQVDFRGGITREKRMCKVGAGELKITDNPTISGLGVNHEGGAIVLDAENCTFGNTGSQNKGFKMATANTSLRFARSFCFKDDNEQQLNITGNAMNILADFGSSTQIVSRIVADNTGLGSKLTGGAGSMLVVKGGTALASSTVLPNMVISMPVEGGLGIRYLGSGPAKSGVAPAGSADTLVLTNCAFTSTGDLEVDAGTVELAAGARWNGDFVARGTGALSGTLKFTEARQARRSSALHLVGSGKIYIPAGVTIRVASVDIDGGEPITKGTFTEDGDSILGGHIEGAGTLKVGARGTVLVVK